MKKFYFLLVAMLVSIAAHADGYYLNGFSCGWLSWTEAGCASYKFTETSTKGVYVLDMSKCPVTEVAGSGLITWITASGADWTKKIGTKSGKIKEGVPYSFNYGSGDNLQIDGTIKNAKLTLNINNKTLLIEGQAEANSFTEVYMIGNFGSDWDEKTQAYPLTKKAGTTDTYEGTYTFTETAPMADYFYCKPKCGAQILGPADGADLTPVMGQTYNLVPTSDKSLSLLPGTYTFTVVADQAAETAKITVTSPDVPVVKEVVFYFDNTVRQWEEVTAILSTGARSTDEYLMEETGVAGILKGITTDEFTTVTFSNGTDETAAYSLKDNYIYGGANNPEGEPYTEPQDWSKIYVNVQGDFNSWGDNGQNPESNGISVHENLAIGTSSFKVKVWDDANKTEKWFSTGGEIATDQWITIPGNNNNNMTITGAAAGERYDVKFNVVTNQIYVTKSTGEIDYTTYFVNVVGDFNSWEFDGVHPDREGVALMDVSNVNTSFKIKVYNGKTDLWYAKEGVLTLDQFVDINGNSDNMTLPADAQTGALKMTFNCATGELKVTKDSGVDFIETDSNEAPVYYNLYGVRVMEPANGLYIVRRGATVTKEIVK